MAFYSMEGSQKDCYPNQCQQLKRYWHLPRKKIKWNILDKTPCADEKILDEEQTYL